MKAPAYFEKVRQRAADRWHQLEADRELAGPWHQLFRQVQSPRHVLSELLQNADDAGARTANVRFDGETFVFEHDGNDFTEEQFASLCRFGFSNKRSLHTIGFRGIGFKSTFSLGNTVEVFSPTLAVRFHSKRFTEPHWIEGMARSENTLIRVQVGDKNRAIQHRGSLTEWAESPSSLLFFKNLRELSIDGAVVKKRITKHGPVERSQFMTLKGEETERLLLVQSEVETLPDDAAEEVRGERGLVDLEDLHLPPCEIEIVLGLNETQRLYVVLPTGAEMPIPFSINAPFIQDPARMKIKDPATSPTNRWLLERAGRLLARTLVDWVNNKDLTMAERARAYELLSKSTDFDTSLGGQCAEIILEAFDEAIENRRLVLTTSEIVSLPGDAIAVPGALYEVWEPSPLLEIFGEDGHRSVVASEVSPAGVEALANRGWITAMDSSNIISRLGQNVDVPRPRGWDNLQRLWEYICADRSLDYDTDSLRKLRLVPVQGDRLLHAANDAIRLSSKRDQLSDDDWQFLLSHTRSVAPDWIAWVGKLQHATEGSGRTKIAISARLLQRLALNEPTPVDRVVAQAFTRLLSLGEVQIADCVRMAQIMAALSARIPEGFQFVTRDRVLRKVEHGIVRDETGLVEDIVHNDWADAHILHPTYDEKFVSCKKEQWTAWVASPASGLHAFVPIKKIPMRLWSRGSVEKTAIERGGQKPKGYHYSRDSFTLDDLSFDEDAALSWPKKIVSDTKFWGRVLEALIRGPVHAWKDKLTATMYHEGNTYRPVLECGHIAAAWIYQSKGIACLPDTFGNLHVPAELLLRTPDTEPLMGIEAFVHADFDNASTRPLLRALGVRESAADAGKIIERIRALSRIPDPSKIIAEIARLYEALDRVIARMAPGQLSNVTTVFAEEDLILSDTNEWLSAGEISIFGDPEASDSAIHSCAQRLSMWLKMNVSERPALEKTIEWLQTLESEQKLDAPELKRIRYALQREPSRIWHSCGHWVSLNGTWEAVDRFKFRLTTKEFTKFADLTPAVKRQTADFRMLNEESTRIEPFIGYRNLSENIEFRVTRCEGDAPIALPAWLQQLASGLQRIRLAAEDETQRIRAIADRLRGSLWQKFRYIEITPYVDGDPAGEPSSPKAVWSSDQVYTADLSTSRIHKDLTEEISRPFASVPIMAAVAACIDRDSEFVADYLAGEFTLDFEDNSTFALKSGAGAVESFPSDGPASTEESSDVEEEADEIPDDESENSEESESDDAESENDTSGEKDPRRPRGTSKPQDPSLTDRYALQRGFQWQPQAARFGHRDGRWIAKDGQPFHWAEHLANGNLARRIWVCEQRLSEGIEVSHELWQTIKNNPEHTAIVSIGEDGRPIALTGVQLVEQKNAGRLAVHPARYRLVSADSVSSENGGLA